MLYPEYTFAQILYANGWKNIKCKWLGEATTDQLTGVHAPQYCLGIFRVVPGLHDSQQELRSAVLQFHHEVHLVLSQRIYVIQDESRDDV